MVYVLISICTFFQPPLSRRGSGDMEVNMSKGVNNVRNADSNYYI